MGGHGTVRAARIARKRAPTGGALLIFERTDFSRRADLGAKRTIRQKAAPDAKPRCIASRMHLTDRTPQSSPRPALAVQLACRRCSPVRPQAGSYRALRISEQTDLACRADSGAKRTIRQCPTPWVPIKMHCLADAPYARPSAPILGFSPGHAFVGQGIANKKAGLWPAFRGWCRLTSGKPQPPW